MESAPIKRDTELRGRGGRGRGKEGKGATENTEGRGSRRKQRRIRGRQWAEKRKNEQREAERGR